MDIWIKQPCAVPQQLEDRNHDHVADLMAKADVFKINQNMLFIHQNLLQYNKRDGIYAFLSCRLKRHIQ